MGGTNVAVSGNGRQVDGRFAKGNQYGKGRPPRATETAYLAVLADSVGLENWKSVCDRAVRDAIAGDAKAREWLAAYVLGCNPKTLSEVTAWELKGGCYTELVAALADVYRAIRRRWQLHEGKYDPVDLADEFLECIFGNPSDEEREEMHNPTIDSAPWDRPPANHQPT